MTSNNSSMPEPMFIQIPPEKVILQLLNHGIKEAKISQRKLAQILETDQASISRKLSGKRSFGVDEISAITALILEQIFPFPKIAIKDFGVNSTNVVSVLLDETVEEAAEKMSNGGFTQLPVLDGNTGECKGVVTDFSLLRRMLEPIETDRQEWLGQLRKMTIKDAGVIDLSPVFPPSSSLTEIAHALVYHYAVLIKEANGTVGIVTRADFLKLLRRNK